MVEKPDAGDIVAQQAVPILPDDTAFDVFGKVTVAAEMALRPRRCRSSSPAPRRASRRIWHGARYFGGRKPEDGRIDWSRRRSEIHNLVRGVAPPYPGAFSTRAGQAVARSAHAVPQPARAATGFTGPCTARSRDAATRNAATASVLRILSGSGRYNGSTSASVASALGTDPVLL